MWSKIWRLKAIKYFSKALLLRWCKGPRYASDLKAATYETCFLKLSQIYIAAWLFSVEIDLFKLWVTLVNVSVLFWTNILLSSYWKDFLNVTETVTGRSSGIIPYNRKLLKISLNSLRNIFHSVHIWKSYGKSFPI